MCIISLKKQAEEISKTCLILINIITIKIYLLLLSLFKQIIKNKYHFNTI